MGSGGAASWGPGAGGEAGARGGGAGGGDWVAPWDGRAGERLKAVRRVARSDTGQDTVECRIKGNIVSKGVRMPHECAR